MGPAIVALITARNFLELSQSCVRLARGRVDLRDDLWDGRWVRFLRGAALIISILSLASCDKIREKRVATAPSPSTPQPITSSASSAVGSTPVSDAGGGDASASASALGSMPADLNVIVLSIDSLRADMPWAGYPRPIAPRLTELEKRAVSYTRAYSISSYTSMSLGGLLGGRLPSGMKRSGFFFGKYSPDNTLFPEVLQAAGVRTISAHAHGYFKDAGFEQGFDAFEIVPGIIFKNETDPNVTSPKHEAIAEKLLDDPALDTKRFFAWFHFLDPHDQYIAHDADGIPPYGPKLRDKYDVEVLFTDRYLGKLLDFIAAKSWARRTAIIVTADHGEAFGEHGMHAHGFELWENLVRVPMFLVVPGVAPKHIDVPRSAIDLAPTILELLQVPPVITVDGGGSLDLEGKSLVAEITGKEPAAERDVILDLPMTSDSDKRRALVRGSKKLIVYGKEEVPRLFDLATDPNEESPIMKGEAFDEMARSYRGMAKNIKEVPPYACGTGCLNRAYVKSGGAAP
jgi:choline-sulfatase